MSVQVSDARMRPLGGEVDVAVGVARPDVGGQAQRGADVGDGRVADVRPRRRVLVDRAVEVEVGLPVRVAGGRRVEPVAVRGSAPCADGRSAGSTPSTQRRVLVHDAVEVEVGLPVGVAGRRREAAGRGCGSAPRAACRSVGRPPAGRTRRPGWTRSPCRATAGRPPPRPWRTGCRPVMAALNSSGVPPNQSI